MTYGNSVLIWIQEFWIFESGFSDLICKKVTLTQADPRLLAVKIVFLKNAIK